MEKKKNQANDFIKEIFKDPRIPEELGLNRCIQCGNCSASCPAARYTPYRPRKIIQNILMGAKKALLENDDIWLCYSCFSCNLRCPRNNNPGLIIHVLRKMALEEGHGWHNIAKFKLYLESLRDAGLGLTPKSLPIDFFQELDNEWKDFKEKLPEILKGLNMNPISPRELPKAARDQIKEILELAKINEEIEKIEKGAEKEHNIKNGDE